MKNIDFLPPELLHKNEVRALRWWWIGIGVAFALIITTTAGLQHFRKREARDELARLEAMIQESKNNEKRLAELGASLQKATRVANLFAFVDHDWPRSQILGELLGPLPDSLQLAELRLTTQELQAPGAAQTSSVAPTQVLVQDPTATAAVDPAQADLEKLAKRAERLRTVLTLNGTTSDVTQLHQYVAKLNSSSLFESAKLEELDAGEAKTTGGLRFVMQVVVKPSYGAKGSGSSRPTADEQEGIANPNVTAVRMRAKKRIELASAIASGVAG